MIKMFQKGDSKNALAALNNWQTVKLSNTKSLLMNPSLVFQSLLLAGGKTPAVLKPEKRPRKHFYFSPHREDGQCECLLDMENRFS